MVKSSKGCAGAGGSHSDTDRLHMLLATPPKWWVAQVVGDNQRHERNRRADVRWDFVSTVERDEQTIGGNSEPTLCGSHDEASALPEVIGCRCLRWVLSNEE